MRARKRLKLKGKGESKIKANFWYFAVPVQCLMKRVKVGSGWWNFHSIILVKIFNMISKVIQVIYQTSEPKWVEATREENNRTDETRESLSFNSISLNKPDGARVPPQAIVIHPGTIKLKIKLRALARDRLKKRSRLTYFDVLEYLFSSN